MDVIKHTDITIVWTMDESGLLEAADKCFYASSLINRHADGFGNDKLASSDELMPYGKAYHAATQLIDVVLQVYSTNGIVRDRINNVAVDKALDMSPEEVHFASILRGVIEDEENYQ